MDFSNDVWLITCAGGKQCSHLIPRILELRNPPKLRLAINSQSSFDRLKELYPSSEPVIADLADPNAVKKLVGGVSAIYHIGPPLHERELSIAKNMIDAAASERRQHGTPKHFVYSSVLHPQLRKLLHHVGKRQAEEHLIESGLEWTILQPSRFLDDFPFEMYKRKIATGEKAIFPAMWNPASTFTFTALEDLGEAALTVLRDRERHFSAIYEIVSTRKRYSYIDVCQLASERLGSQVHVQTLSFEEAVATFFRLAMGKEKADVPLGKIDIVERMLLDYNYKGLVGNANVLEWLIGREGISVEKYFDGFLP